MSFTICVCACLYIYISMGIASLDTWIIHVVIPGIHNQFTRLHNRKAKGPWGSFLPQSIGKFKRHRSNPVHSWNHPFVTHSIVRGYIVNSNRLCNVTNKIHGSNRCWCCHSLNVPFGGKLSKDKSVTSQHGANWLVRASIHQHDTCHLS